jgi:transposase
VKSVGKVLLPHKHFIERKSHMLSSSNLSRFILLPELKLTRWFKEKTAANLAWAETTSKHEICPKCATPSFSIYDSRHVTLRDAPVRGMGVKLKVRKHRFFCKPCKKPFTQPIQGVGKRQRTTQRFRRDVLWASENFSDLKKVRKAYRCSSAFIYKILFEQLDLNVRKKINYPWPESIGLDEHFFTRRRGRAEFCTVFTDHSNRRLREVAFGKTKDALKYQLATIEGRQNVRLVTLDMSDSYRSFVTEFFPNAEMIADKFHVLRLLTPAINKARVQITGDKRKSPLRWLLLKPRYKLDYFERGAIDRWLIDYPELKELYWAREMLFTFYRTKGIERASVALTNLTDRLALSKLKPIRKLRRTLMSWRSEILNYFKTRLTNARTEGFNNVAKLVQKRAYGYKSFENYRLRLLNACC